MPKEGPWLYIMPPQEVSRRGTFSSSHECMLVLCSIESMQPGAIIVNVSRGGLVDVDAAMDALESGQLGGLAMDVYEQEGEQENYSAVWVCARSAISLKAGAGGSLSNSRA